MPERGKAVFSHLRRSWSCQSFWVWIDVVAKATMNPQMPKLSPIPIKDRLSMAFVAKGELNVLDGTFVVVDESGVRTHIPVGGVCCILLEPGSRVSHSAVALAGRVGTLLIWIGESGVRLYAAGQPGGARADKLLYQASLALNKETRTQVARAMYAFRFAEQNVDGYSIEQLRGMEGARVRALYQKLSKVYGLIWQGRRYDPQNISNANCANRCFSSATACLYGLCEAAILAAGYSPTIGFVHYGKARSFVFDIADLFKFETVLPVAFKIAAQKPSDPESEVRKACRDAFRETRLLKRIIPAIEEILAAGGMPVPDIAESMVMPAFKEEKGFGDPGHRG